MTLHDGFDRTVAAWLDEQAGRGRPDYLDETLARTTRTRQRPAWSSLERWLPVQTTIRFVPVPRVAWLLVLLAIVLALAAALLVAGSRPRVAPTFGIVRNGPVLYAADTGDLHRVDLATGEDRLLTADGVDYSDLHFSKDGSRLLMLRDASSWHASVLVANADASNITPVVGALQAVDRFEPSPDGSKVVVIGEVAGQRLASIFDIDHHMAETSLLPLGLHIQQIGWRRDGSELAFYANDGGHAGFYAIRSDGTGLRPIRPIPDGNVVGPALSPDGKAIAYMTWDAASLPQGVLHLLEVDTGEVTTPVFDGTTTADENVQWSPDGQRLLFERYTAAGSFRLASAPVIGGHVTEMGPTEPELSGGSDAQFSPDGTKVLAVYQVDKATWLLDPVGGTETKLPWSAAWGWSWRREAP